jgi:uncharacterized protein YdgA (DUF945 family)
MTKLTPARFLFSSNSQILASFDTFAKNDEITPVAIFFPDQPVKFEPIPTQSRKMTKSPLRDFCFRSTSQILSNSNTVTKNDEITPGVVFVPDQPVKFEPIPTQ